MCLPQFLFLPAGWEILKKANEIIADVYQVDFSTQSLSVLNKAKERLLIRKLQDTLRAR